MITRTAVPQSSDCFGIVFPLHPLTFRLDNIVATLAKHPILCRYSAIETPIFESILEKNVYHLFIGPSELNVDNWNDNTRISRAARKCGLWVRDWNDNSISAAL